MLHHKFMEDQFCPIPFNIPHNMSISEIKDWENTFLEIEKEKKRAVEQRLFKLELEMKCMKEKFQRLKDERSDIVLIDVPKMSDNEAQKQIECHLKKYITKEKKVINILDIMSELNLPLDQIERIMKKLEEKGVEEIE